MKKTIILDFDNTIVNTTEAICSLYNEDFSYYKDFKPVKWWDISWGFNECSCATKEYINTYFNQPRFFERVKFMYRADIIIPLLQKEYNIKIVSMGHKPNLKLKKEWIKKHIPCIEFIGVNIKKHNDKSHIDMANCVFIDDSALMLENSNAETKLCFGDINECNKNWNGTRVLNWTDIKELLLYGVRNDLITTVNMLIRDLEKALHYKEDDFLTVSISNREYIIDNIQRISDCTDDVSSHLTLNVREGGQGNIRR